jgi:hypothetical protein
VLGTISATEHERAWNARTLVFLLIAFLIAAAMGVLTYYYHLHEDDEDGEGDSNVAAITREVPLPYGRGSVSRWETDQQPRHSAVAVTHRAVTKGSGQRPVEPRA